MIFAVTLEFAVLTSLFNLATISHECPVKSRFIVMNARSVKHQSHRMSTPSVKCIPYQLMSHCTRCQWISSQAYHFRMARMCSSHSQTNSPRPFGSLHATRRQAPKTPLASISIIATAPSVCRPNLYQTVTHVSPLDSGGP